MQPHLLKGVGQGLPWSCSVYLEFLVHLSQSNQPTQSATFGKIDFGLPAPVSIGRQALPLLKRFGVALRRARAQTGW